MVPAADDSCISGPDFREPRLEVYFFDWKQPGLNHFIHHVMNLLLLRSRVRVMKKKSKKSVRTIPKMDNLKQINLNAAGIDIGSTEIWVCVPESRDDKPVRVFQTFTRDLHDLANWLKTCQVTTVAMESTGIYWIPLYEILVAAGLEVKLVNARKVKNVPGRKSDVLDCQWLQQLHTYGLLAASFMPEAGFTALRAFVRHRENLINCRSMHIQHMQKALHLMNLQLDNVISDITGITGMRIIRAIVDGHRSPEVLASYRDPHCKNDRQVIAKSLEGNYKHEYIFQLRQALALYDFYTQQLKACDLEIEKEYAKFSAKANPLEKPLPPLPPRRDRREKNDPAFDLRTYLYHLGGVDLTAIDGCNALTIQTVISEIGVDMSKWPTLKHFTSWLCLCPDKEVSGGKVLRTRTRKTKNRANKALRMAAQSLHHSHSALGAYFRRMRAKLGAPKAITAAAHKIARIIYLMLKYKKEYVDLGADYYEFKYREREIRKLKHKAARMGFQVVPIAA